jgi:signal transduction histidine kinase
VILGRLSVRERVNLLALIPLLVLLLLQVPLLASRLDDARTSSLLAERARTARSVSRLVQEIQLGRLLSVAYLGGPSVAPNEVVVQLQEVEAQRAALLDQLDGATAPALVAALGEIGRLQDVGENVVAHRLTGAQADEAFSRLVSPLFNALDLSRAAGSDGAGLRGLQSLDSLLRSDEYAGRRATALLTATTVPPEARSASISAAHDAEISEAAAADQFRRFAEPDGAGLFAVVDVSEATGVLSEAYTRLSGVTRGALSGDLAARVFASARSQTLQRQVVELQVAQHVVDSAQSRLRDAQILIGLVGSVGVGFLVLIVLLSVTVGQSVTAPLRRLTAAAGTVADLAQEELLRVADEDTPQASTPRLAAIQVRTEDEIGDLAAAFNRVQATAALLLERQVVSRRNVAAMFGSVGRRTSNLVGRQLALIDSLERVEEDPDALAALYRLDHAATRLRRSASSLVVLSGGTEGIGEGRPMPLADVVRAALATVEDYQRVTLKRLPKLWISPGVVSDLALLFAELLENAVTFSPPRTEVEVVGLLQRDGSCTLSVIDHGMGMPAPRLAEENRRLQRRERLDLAPSDVLGLFVVGRIARRHGVAVHLEATEPAGITAVVALPSRLMVHGHAAGGAAGSTLGVGRARDAAAVAGAARRDLAALAGRRQVGDLAIPPLPAAGWQGHASGRNAGTVGGLPRRVRGANWRNDTAPAVRTPDAAAATPAAVTPALSAPPPAPPPGAEGLARRVPGSNLGAFAAADSAAAAGGPRPVDAEAVRQDVDALESAIQRAGYDAEHGDPPEPAPTVAEVAARSGLVRRVPGAALDAMDHSAAPRPASGEHLLADASPRGQARGPFDPETVRTALDDVDIAVRRAREAEQTAPIGNLTAWRHAEQEARAVRNAVEGRRDAQRAAVERLRDHLLTPETAASDTGEQPSSSPTPPSPGRQPPTVPLDLPLLDLPPFEPAPVDPALLDPAPLPPAFLDQAPRDEVPPGVRRVPGASLAALGYNGPGSLNGRRALAVNGSLHSPRHDAAPRTTSIALTPERPEDVRAWADDLQAAVARIEDQGPTTADGTHEPPATHGDTGDSTGGEHG